MQSKNKNKKNALSKFMTDLSKEESGVPGGGALSHPLLIVKSLQEEI